MRFFKKFSSFSNLYVILAIGLILFCLVNISILRKNNIKRDIAQITAIDETGRYLGKEKFPFKRLLGPKWKVPKEFLCSLLMSSDGNGAFKVKASFSDIDIKPLTLKSDDKGFYYYAHFERDQIEFKKVREGELCKESLNELKDYNKSWSRTKTHNFTLMLQLVSGDIPAVVVLKKRSSFNTRNYIKECLFTLTTSDKNALRKGKKDKKVCVLQ